MRRSSLNRLVVLAMVVMVVLFVSGCEQTKLKQQLQEMEQKLVMMRTMYLEVQANVNPAVLDALEQAGIISRDDRVGTEHVLEILGKGIDELEQEHAALKRRVDSAADDIEATNAVLNAVVKAIGIFLPPPYNSIFTGLGGAAIIVYGLIQRKKKNKAKEEVVEVEEEKHQEEKVAMAVIKGIQDALDKLPEDEAEKVKASLHEAQIEMAVWSNVRDKRAQLKNGSYVA